MDGIKVEYEGQAKKSREQKRREEKEDELEKEVVLDYNRPPQQKYDVNEWEIYKEKWNQFNKMLVSCG